MKRQLAALTMCTALIFAMGCEEGGGQQSQPTAGANDQPIVTEAIDITPNDGPDGAETGNLLNTPSDGADTDDMDIPPDEETVFVSPPKTDGGGDPGTTPTANVDPICAEAKDSPAARLYYAKRCGFEVPTITTHRGDRHDYAEAFAAGKEERETAFKEIITSGRNMSGLLVSASDTIKITAGSKAMFACLKAWAHEGEAVMRDKCTSSATAEEADDEADARESSGSSGSTDPRRAISAAQTNIALLGRRDIRRAGLGTVLNALANASNANDTEDTADAATVCEGMEPHTYDAYDARTAVNLIVRFTHPDVAARSYFYAFSSNENKLQELSGLGDGRLQATLSPDHANWNITVLRGPNYRGGDTVQLNPEADEPEALAPGDTRSQYLIATLQSIQFVAAQAPTCPSTNGADNPDIAWQGQIERIVRLYGKVDGVLTVPVHQIYPGDTAVTFLPWDIALDVTETFVGPHGEPQE